MLVFLSPLRLKLQRQFLELLAVYKSDFMLNPNKKNGCGLRYILRLLTGYMMVSKY
jgi:hypothetical protein